MGSSTASQPRSARSDRNAHNFHSHRSRSSLAREAALPIAPLVERDPQVRDELWQAILDLPSRQRAAIVLRFYEDLSELQAAEVLRCSVKALNQLVVRAMKTLRTRIEEDER